MYKLRNTTMDCSNSTSNEHFSTEMPIQVMFENYLTIAAFLPNILFMLLNTMVTKL